MATENVHNLDDLLAEGMDSLLGEVTGSFTISITKVHANPNQPRLFFDKDKLKELASSIKQHGQLYPVLVMADLETKGEYILVGGERRYRAIKEELGWDSITVIEVEGNLDELALIDNIQREDLNPIEEASQLQLLKEKYDYTDEQLGDVIGKNHQTVSASIKINNLPEKIRKDYLNLLEEKIPTSGFQAKSNPRITKITKSHLIELAEVSKKKDQAELWKMIKKGISIKAIRQHKATQASLEKTPQNQTTIKERFLKTADKMAEKISQMATVDIDLNANELDKLDNIQEILTAFINEQKKKLGKNG